jgi:hypothetical protein
VAAVLTPYEACELIRRDYAPDETVDCEARYDNAGVQASVVRHAGRRIGIIRGSDELGDWIQNARWAPRAGVLLSAAVAVPSAGARYCWHRGFLEHARAAWEFFMAHPRPDTFIGHSLGAAAVQIVASSQDFAGTPAICFASPRPLWARSNVISELILSYCRVDDPVCRAPPRWMGFRHVGRVIWLRPDRWNPRQAHGVVRYAAMLERLEAAAADGAGVGAP